MALNELNITIIDNLKICSEETKLILKPTIYCTIINKITITINCRHFFKNMIVIYISCA